MKQRDRVQPGMLGAPVSASVREPTDGVLLPSRVPAVLLATVGMTAVFGAGVAVGVPMTERHLRADIARHVLADMPSVRAKVNGRAVSLVGSVASIDDRSELGDRVRSRWGIASVSIDGLAVIGSGPAAVAAKQTSAAGPSTSGRGAGSTKPSAKTLSRSASPGAGQSTTPDVGPAMVAPNRAAPTTSPTTSQTTRDRKSTRLNSSHPRLSRMPSSA